MAEQKQSGKIGLWATTSLVIGNMIGSGVFLLPASLAAFGGVSLLGWIGSSIGAIVLALMFSRLSKKVTNSVGGPYAYTRSGLGDFAAFLVAWGYWISIWVTNAAIAVAFVSYLTVFFPVLETRADAAILTGLGAVWLLTWVNTRGVKEAGFVQTLTVILKIIPLVAVSVAGLFFIDMDNFKPFNTSGGSGFAAVTATATLTLFAFLGLESATIPSGDIDQPERTIPKATMIGTIITILIYVLGSFVVMGMIPSGKLMNSSAPFADAAAIMWGDSARYWVAAGAIVSTFGALNGWILLQGQMPMAASRDKLFPKWFGKVNRKGTPAVSIVASSILITVLLLMNYSKGLSETFTFMVLLTTLTVLIAYIFSATAYGVLLLQEKFRTPRWTANMLLAIVAFIFSLWAIIGSGEETVFWGFIALLAGMPFYVWMKRNAD